MPRVVSRARLHRLVLILGRQMDGVVSTGLVLGRRVTEHVLGTQLLRDGGVDIVHAILLFHLEVPAPGLLRKPLQDLLAVGTGLL